MLCMVVDIGLAPPAPAIYKLDVYFIQCYYTPFPGLRPWTSTATARFWQSGRRWCTTTRVCCCMIAGRRYDGTPLARHPRLSSSTHHAVCTETVGVDRCSLAGKVGVDLIKLPAACAGQRTVPYLWPGIPVFHVVSTMYCVRRRLGLL